MSHHTTWTVRADCDRCGIVRIDGEQIVLRIAEEDGAAAVRFTCPDCGSIDVHPVADRQATALVGAGVDIELWAHSPELDEHRDGAPITLHDLETWATLLADGDAFDAAVRQLFDVDSR